MSSGAQSFKLDGNESACKALCDSNAQCGAFTLYTTAVAISTGYTCATYSLQSVASGSIVDPPPPPFAKNQYNLYIKNDIYQKLKILFYLKIFCLYLLCI